MSTHKPKYQAGDVVQVISSTTGRVLSPKAVILDVEFESAVHSECIETGSVKVLYDTYSYLVSCFDAWVCEISIHPYPKHRSSQFESFQSLMDSFELEVSA